MESDTLLTQTGAFIIIVLITFISKPHLILMESCTLLTLTNYWSDAGRHSPEVETGSAAEAKDWFYLVRKTRLAFKETGVHKISLGSTSSSTLALLKIEALA